jgi:hypothetical protein
MAADLTDLPVRALCAVLVMGRNSGAIWDFEDRWECPRICVGMTIDPPTLKSH